MTDTDLPGVPNGRIITPGLFRGGQPDAEGWATLLSRGVTRVIRLNTGSDALEDALERAGRIVVHRFPISTFSQIFGKPPRSLWVNVVRLMVHSGTFLHCALGKDRTGTAAGCFRVQAQGWTKAEAYAEAKELGFHPLLRGLCWSWEEDVDADDFWSLRPRE